MKRFLSFGKSVALVLMITACRQISPSTGEFTPSAILEQTKTVTSSPSANFGLTPFPTIESTSVVENASIDKTPLTINLWHPWEEERVIGLLEAVEVFNAAYPEIRFNLTYVPYDELITRFSTPSSLNAKPTLLIGPTEWGPDLFDANLIAELSNLARPELLSSINEVALKGIRFNDALIGLPVTFSKGVVLYRNTSIVPSPPASFDDLVATAQENTGNGVAGAFLDVGFTLSGGHLTGIGGQLLDESGRPRFNDDKGIEWIDLLSRFEEAGPVDNNTDTDVEYFKNGEVGMIIDGTWNLENIVEALGIENLAIDPWPEPLSGYVWTESLFLNAEIDDREASAGWAFIEYMLSPEVQALMVESSSSGQIPVVTDTEIIDPLLIQILDAFSGGVAVPALPQMIAYWDPMNNAVKSVVVGEDDPEIALARAEEEILSKLAVLDNSE